MPVTPETTQTAVNELLREDTPEALDETLDLFFESWLASEASDGTTVSERSTRLCHYKAIHRFFNTIRSNLPTISLFLICIAD